ncbi:MAG: carcinine hydrolase/isopenicillin-N N-acyltransferase family protein [Candidatus Methanofastidiosia archaeon]|jgi:hypothetical protein
MNIKIKGKKGKKIYKIAVILLIINGVLILPTIGLMKGTMQDIYLQSCMYYDSNNGTASNDIMTEPTHTELCSVLTFSNQETVLFGGNVDTHPDKYSGTLPYIVVFPPSQEDNTKYGFVVIGWEWKEHRTHYTHFACGINEKGLAFATNGLPEVSLNFQPEKSQSNPESFKITALKQCSTIDDVIEKAKTFDWGDSISMQIHFADATGDAVVISAGKDGEIAFTRKSKKYLVSTNFNKAHPENGTYPCWRYNTAVNMLKDIDSITIQNMESVLDAIHVEGTFVNTVFSYIFDLSTGDGYVYYFHQFDEVVEFNITTELAETTEGAISEWYTFNRLFSPETLNKAAIELWEHQIWIAILKIVFGITALVVFCFFIYKNVRNRK